MIEIPKDIDAIISCDLETTGLDIHSACWITGSFGKICPKTFKTIDELELTSRPYHWDEEARKIHRFSFATANEFDDRQESLNRLIEWLPKNRRFAFLCHASESSFGIHAHFDLAIIKADFLFQDRYFDFYKIFDDKKIISTVTIARALNMESAKLKNLADYFKIELDHHNASSDRRACEEIFRRFLSRESNCFDV